jgi:predicted secreted Zn-dependent protease
MIAVLAGCSDTEVRTRPPARATLDFSWIDATDGPTFPTVTASPRATASPEATPSPKPTAAPTAGTDQAIPRATMVYYNVTGKTANALRSSLKKLGPLDDSGHRYDAMTVWSVSWNWPGYGTSTCNLEAATVTLDVKVEFPHWVKPASPSKSLVTKWNAYMKALALHEKGHVDYVADHYQAAATAIKAATCLTATAAGNKALLPIDKHDVSYDAATHHGATQGATFP